MKDPIYTIGQVVMYKVRFENKEVHHYVEEIEKIYDRNEGFWNYEFKTNIFDNTPNRCRENAIIKVIGEEKKEEWMPV